MSGFLHESIVPKMKKFQVFFAKFDLWVTRPGNRPKVKTKKTLKNRKYFTFPIAGYCYPEIDQFPGDNTWKSTNFLVALTGNQYEKTLIL